ncbi:MAG: tetratricopeptide repeat protein [Bacteroidetes bacterium]|nr:tetratricopeptide repeat protein [Bacteroidota bacterium]
MSRTETEIALLKKEIDDANIRVWNLRAAPKTGHNPEELIANAYKNSLEISYRFGEAQSLLNLGMGAFIIHHDYPLSDKYLTEAIQIFQEIQNQKWEANAFLTQAIIKNSTGNPESALYLGLRGMEFYYAQQKDQDYTMACYVVGTIYKDLQKPDDAERFFRLGISTDLDYNSWNARVYTGLSNILSSREEFEEALKMGQKGLELLRYEDNQIGVSRALNDLGAIYQRLKQYDKALEYISEALKIRKENNFKHFVLGSLLDIAGIYFEKEEYDKALPYYLEAEPLAISTNHSGRLAVVYRRVAEIYKKTGNLNESVAAFEKLIEVINVRNQQDKEAKISQSESKLLKEKEDEIERLRNVELKHAYDLIAEKNKEITDSIHYANRIQKTILAPEPELEKFLGTHFVFFQPKDIVSGDFYWSIVMDREENHRDFYLAVCDSTGHGVPGAFMSLLNTNYLNEAIYEKQIAEPHLVFNYVRQRLIESISKEGQKDGFDGILARIDVNAKTLHYAAANNTPVLIRDGKIMELPADKMPVGYGEKKDSFNLHEIVLQKGDALYFYTDGYADQFGGPNGKKFKYRQLNELLTAIAKSPVQEQAEKLRTVFDAWKGSLEQVDDVCVIGVRL